MVIAIFAGTTGCGNSSADPTEDPTAEASISSDGADEEEMSSETESSQQSETPGESTDPEQSVSSSSNTSSPGSTPGTGNQGTPGTNSGNRSANGGNSQSSSSSTPSTPAPSSPQSSAPSTSSTPDSTSSSAPKTAYDYPFDPEQIKQDMIAYGKSLGMKQGSASSSTGAITASSSLQGTALKNALMNRVAWYANPDNLAAYGGDPVEYFNVTYSGSDGNYSFVFWY